MDNRTWSRPDPDQKITKGSGENWNKNRKMVKILHNDPTVGISRA